jgi:hypothetical protein
MKRRVLVMVGLLLVVGAAGLVLARHASVHEPLPPVTQAAWASECGGCHMAYHPALLPARSWRALLEQSSSHFGQDLALEKGVVTEIMAFLATNAADNSPHQGARRLAGQIAAEYTPKRITESKWFVGKHDEIEPNIWRRKAVGGPGNCEACHTRAAAGDLSEISIPE